MTSRKHAYIILTPLNPQLYKRNLQGYTIFFYIFAQNIDCGYSIEPPRLAEAVLTSIHNLIFEQKYKNIRDFYLKFSVFGSELLYIFE